MISTPYRIVSTWKTFGTSLASVLMTGSHAGSSRVSRGNSVMKNAPAIARERGIQISETS